MKIEDVIDEIEKAVFRVEPAATIDDVRGDIRKAVEQFGMESYTAGYENGRKELASELRDLLGAHPRPGLE